MKVVEYDPSRRSDVAEPDGARLGRAARRGGARLVLRAKTRCGRPRSCSPRRTGRRSARRRSRFLPMSIGGERLEVGMPLARRDRSRLPRPRDLRELEEANEERVRVLGVRLLLTVPNAASDAGVPRQARLVAAALAPRVVAAGGSGAGSRASRSVERFAALPAPEPGAARPGAAGHRLAELALRRLADAVHAARRATDMRSRGRGRIGVLAAVEGALIGDAGRAAREATP